jgi:hypothetical protein
MGAGESRWGRWLPGGFFRTYSGARGGADRHGGHFSRWLLVAVALTIDTAIPDLLKGINRGVSKAGKKVIDQSTQLTQKVNVPSIENKKSGTKKKQLDLEGFTPIDEMPAAQSGSGKKKTRGAALPEQLPNPMYRTPRAMGSASVPVSNERRQAWHGSYLPLPIS